MLFLIQERWLVIMLLGSIEFKNDNVICAISDFKLNLKDKLAIPLESPVKTFNQIVKYFNQFDDLKAVGISSFGPIELRTASPKYGYLLDTTRSGWTNINLLGTLSHYLNVPMSFTTDVNSEAYGKYIESVLENHPIYSLVYYSVGNGIGAGIVNNGQFVGHNGSSEIGHIYPKKDVYDQDFNGTCLYQGDCLEGLVAQPSFKARFSQPSNQISMLNPVWQAVANYLAQSIIQSTLFIRPDKIIINSSMINQIELNKIKEQFKSTFNNYLNVGNLDDYLQLETKSGEDLSINGNILLAKKKFFESEVIYK